MAKIGAQPRKYRVRSGASYQNPIKVYSGTEQANKIV